MITTVAFIGIKLVTLTAKYLNYDNNVISLNLKAKSKLYFEKYLHYVIFQTRKSYKF